MCRCGEWIGVDSGLRMWRLALVSAVLATAGEGERLLRATAFGPGLLVCDLWVLLPRSLAWYATLVSSPPRSSGGEGILMTAGLCKSLRLCQAESLVKGSGRSLHLLLHTSGKGCITEAGLLLLFHAGCSPKSLTGH